MSDRSPPPASRSRDHDDRSPRQEGSRDRSRSRDRKPSSRLALSLESVANEEACIFLLLRMLGGGGV
jgi:hypothetical protein